MKGAKTDGSDTKTVFKGKGRIFSNDGLPDSVWTQVGNGGEIRIEKRRSTVRSRIVLRDINSGNMLVELFIGAEETINAAQTDGEGEIIRGYHFTAQEMTTGRYGLWAVRLKQEDSASEFYNQFSIAQRELRSVLPRKIATPTSAQQQFAAGGAGGALSNGLSMPPPPFFSPPSKAVFGGAAVTDPRSPVASLSSVGGVFTTATPISTNPSPTAVPLSVDATSSSSLSIVRAASSPAGAAVSSSKSASSPVSAAVVSPTLQRVASPQAPLSAAAAAPASISPSTLRRVHDDSGAVYTLTVNELALAEKEQAIREAKLQEEEAAATAAAAQAAIELANREAKQKAEEAAPATVVAAATSSSNSASITSSSTEASTSSSNSSSTPSSTEASKAAGGSSVVGYLALGAGVAVAASAAYYLTRPGAQPGRFIYQDVADKVKGAVSSAIQQAKDRFRK